MTTKKITKKDIEAFANGNFKALNKYNKRPLAQLYHNLDGEITFVKKPSKSGNKTLNNLRANAVYYYSGNHLLTRTDILKNLSTKLYQPGLYRPGFTVHNLYPNIKNKYF